MEKNGSLRCSYEGEGTDKNPVVGGNHDNLFKAVNDAAAGDKVAKFNIKDEVFPAKCVRVYDGDTIYVVFEYNGILSEFAIRMYGYNSAELKTANEDEKKKGLAAKEYIKELVLGKHVFVQMLGNDKYGGRWLGKVYLVREDGGNDKFANIVGGCVNSMMVAAGHGVPYFGKGEKKY